MSYHTEICVLTCMIFTRFFFFFFKIRQKEIPHKFYDSIPKSSPISPKVALKIQTGMIGCLPRKRTMSIMIIVRNTLFQNLDIQLQILRWKMLCHLHKHVKSQHYGAQHHYSWQYICRRNKHHALLPVVRQTWHTHNVVIIHYLVFKQLVPF